MKINVKKVADVYTAVADVGALVGWVPCSISNDDGDGDGESGENGSGGGNRDRDRYRDAVVLVAGVGFERWRVPLDWGVGGEVREGGSMVK